MAIGNLVRNLGGPQGCQKIVGDEGEKCHREANATVHRVNSRSYDHEYQENAEANE